MSNVFVLDTNKHPLNPVHPGRARILLSQGEAAVYRRFPFTIILKEAVEHPALEPLRLKIDPGSKTTGLALVNDASGQIVWAAELSHRGHAIKAALDTRRAIRRNRRNRKTRYRKPRFQHHPHKQGWLPPSLESRIANVLTWTRRLMRFCPIATISQELVKFDTQALQNPAIEGVEYQEGTLFGYELRECLLEKWGTQLVQDFLEDKPVVLARILAQAKAPLKDAAAVNATRWSLYERLTALGLPVECGTGGRTKFNRVSRNLAKAHWMDAACVGASTPEHLDVKDIVPLLIKATGRGSRHMCRMDRYGFPRTGPKQAKRVKGFQTGDMVKAVVTAGKKAGTYFGRVAVRMTGSFNITTKQGTVQGVSHRFCTPVHRSDGYSYQAEAAA